MEKIDKKEQFSRMEMLLGEEALERLFQARVVVFGVGGVGGFAAEALARCGVGHLTLIDNDTVSVSNLNRQLIALRSTIGRHKVDVMKERIADINPDAEVDAIPMFYLPENADEFDLSSFDYVIDAIDTVKAKIELAVRCHALGIPFISSMGAGNKLHPEAFEIADISKTSVCPLARVMRKELRSRGIQHMKVVYSKEEAKKPEGGERFPGSIAFVPSAAGLILAGEVVRDLAADKSGR